MTNDRLPAFGQMCLAHARHIYREPEILFWAFVFPVLLAAGLGLAFRAMPQEATWVGILDQAGAHELAAIFQTQDPAQIQIQILSPKQSQKALRTGKITALLTPGNPPELALDPSRPDAALTRLVILDALRKARQPQPEPPLLQEREMTLAGMRYIDFLLPALLGMNIMNSGIWGLGFGLVEMRLKKFLKRLAATPMHRSDFLLSMLTVRLILILLEIGALLCVGIWLFGTQIHGSWALLLFIGTLGCLAFASIGIWIGSRISKIETAMAVINLVTMPMYLLSGVFFSYERFPESMQFAIKLLPLTALNDALRGVVNEGASLFELGQPLIVLGAWTFLGFWAGLRKFRWI